MKWLRRYPRPRMRTLLVVLLLLVAGAIVNVAVAWGCVLWPSTNRDVQQMSRSWATAQLERAFGQGLVFDSVRGTIDHGRGCTEEQAVGAENRSPGGKGYVWTHATIGWPAHALEATTLLNGAPPLTTTGLVAPSFLNRYGAVLPVQPIWPGFLLNSLLFGTMTWMLVGVLRSLFSHWLTLRNRCEACGYDLTGNKSGQCPECGARI